MAAGSTARKTGSPCIDEAGSPCIDEAGARVDEPERPVDEPDEADEADVTVAHRCSAASASALFPTPRAPVMRTPSTLPDAALTVADAQAAPFKDRSFALIVNVESFHAVDAKRFFSEARRILTADGLLIIIDFRKAPVDRLQHWVTEQAEAAGMSVVEFLDLTRNAIASARSDAPRRNRLLKRIPLPFKKLANKMTAGEGSDLLKQYLDGEKTYFLCVLKSANIQIDR
jgi:SAM-dependent methyltransferase